MTIEAMWEKPPLLYILPAAVSAIFCAEIGLPGLAAGSPFEDTAEIHGHLVVAFPEVGYCVESHGSDTRDPLRHHLYGGRMEMQDGYLHLGDKPGFGLEIDWKVVERYRL